MNLLDIHQYSNEVHSTLERFLQRAIYIEGKRQIVTADELYRISKLKEIRDRLILHIQDLFKEVENEFKRVMDLHMESYESSLRDIGVHIQGTILHLQTFLSSTLKSVSDYTRKDIQDIESRLNTDEENIETIF